MFSLKIEIHHYTALHWQTCIITVIRPYIHHKAQGWPAFGAHHCWENKLLGDHGADIHGMFPICSSDRVWLHSMHRSLSGAGNLVQIHRAAAWARLLYPDGLRLSITSSELREKTHSLSHWLHAGLLWGRWELLVHPFPFLALPRHVRAEPSQNKSDLQWLLDRLWPSAVW